MTRRGGLFALLACCLLLPVSASPQSVGTVTVDLGGSDGYIVTADTPSSNKKAPRYFDGDVFTCPAGTTLYYRAFDSTGKVETPAAGYAVTDGGQTLSVPYCRVLMDLSGTDGTIRIEETKETFTDGQAKWLPLGVSVGYSARDATGKIATPPARKTVDCTPISPPYCAMAVDLDGSDGFLLVQKTNEVLVHGQTKLLPLGATFAYTACDSTGTVRAHHAEKTVDCTPLKPGYCLMAADLDGSDGSALITASGEELAHGQAKWVPLGASFTFVALDGTGTIAATAATKTVDCTPLRAAYCLMAVDLDGGDGSALIVESGERLLHGQAKWLPLGARFSFIATDSTEQIAAAPAEKTADCTPLRPGYCRVTFDLGGSDGWLRVAETGECFADGQAKWAPLGAVFTYEAYDVTGNVASPAAEKTVDCTPLAVPYCDLIVDLDGSPGFILVAETEERLYDGAAWWVPVGAVIHYESYEPAGVLHGPLTQKVIDCTPLSVPPILHVTPDAADFGDVYVDESADRSFTVTNVGTGILSGVAEGLAAPFSCPGDPSYALGPGQQKAVTVRFAPLERGAASDAVEFTGGEGKLCPVSGMGLSVPTARSWGWNPYGQLGDGTNTGTNVAVRVKNLTYAARVAAGYNHSLSTKEDGSVWAWGWNTYGQLGDGTSTSTNVAVQVRDLEGVTAVAGGYYHSLALKGDGTAWAWGRNLFGQLGDGTNANTNVAVRVQGLSGVTALDGGFYHSLALKDDGTAWAWGSNLYGQLGDGTSSERRTPVQVAALSGATAVAAGAYHSLVAKNDGSVWGWGANMFGQLGDGTSTNTNVAVRVQGLEGVTAVAGGYYHSLALKSDGTVWAWGYNSNGQLGNDSTVSSSVPVQVVNLTGVVAIAAGFYHSLALKDDGTVWTWGLNNGGQLGDGSYLPSSVPVQVGNLSGATSVAGGGYHSLAVKQ